MSFSVFSVFYLNILAKMIKFIKKSIIYFVLILYYFRNPFTKVSLCFFQATTPKPNMSLHRKKNNAQVPTGADASAHEATPAKSVPEQAICFLLTMVAALCHVPALNIKEWKQAYGKDIIRFVYVGIGGPTEDAEYFANPLLHKEMPRGYIEVYLNGKFVRTIHGCNKFFGEEDEASNGIDTKNKLPKVCVGDFTIDQLSVPGVMVDITAKANGKFMTFSFFETDGQIWVILSSKTTAVAFHLGGNAPSFSKNGGEENHILKGMYETFNRFWSELPQNARDTLVSKSVKDHFTYLAEYEDGAHMVHLPKPTAAQQEDGAHMVPLSGNNTIAITMVIRCSQSGKPSKSEMLHFVDGIHFADWLQKIGVPNIFIIQHLLCTIQEWNEKYSLEYSNTNFFEPGKIIEGYVVRFISADGNIMALMKSKTWEYIIKRSMREILRGLIRSFKKDKKPITPADASFRLRKKLTGPKAYPQGLSRSAVDACCQLAAQFVEFCLKMNTGRGIALDNFVNFGGATGTTDACHPNGMACSWEMFLAYNGGPGLPEALALTDEPSTASDSAATATDETDKPKYVPNLETITAMIAFIMSCVAGVRKFKLGDVVITATSYGRQTATTTAPIIILQAISGTGKTTLAELLAKQMNAIIGCADDFFKLKCGGKFIPKLLGQAHQFCRDTVFATPLDQPVIVSNTNCNLNDASKYVEHAHKTCQPVIFLRMEPNGTFEEFAAKLAVRGEHVKDISILAKQWQTMTQKSNIVPSTYEALIKRFNLSASSSAPSSATSAIVRKDVSYASAAIPKKLPTGSAAVPKEPTTGPAALKKSAWKKATPYTALIVELSKFRELLPNTKPELHITLNFGEHVRALLVDPRLARLSFTISEVREYVDPANKDNFIACAVVKSDVLAELQNAGLVKDNLHITLAVGRSFKPADSNKLMDGSLTPTRIVKVPSEASVYVGTVAAMPLPQ